MQKKGLLNSISYGAAFLILASLSFSTPSQAQVKTRGLSTFCKTVRSLSSGEIYKSIASHHITDARRANSTSFITLRSTKAPKNSCLYVYDKAGNLIHKMGRYYPTGDKYSSRFYGGSGCGDGKSANTVAATARKNTGSTEVYITSGTGNCAKIPNPSLCINSSGC